MNAPALDLAKHMADKQTREAASQLQNERAAEAAAMQQVARWDRKMARAFKGIVTRPERHRMLLRATEGVDA